MSQVRKISRRQNKKHAQNFIQHTNKLEEKQKRQYTRMYEMERKKVQKKVSAYVKG